MGYRSMLSAVFKSVLPEISSSPVLHDLIRSFQVEAPIRGVRPPSWDLPTVLNYLRSSFEPLSTLSYKRSYPQDFIFYFRWLQLGELGNFRLCLVEFLSPLLPLVCLMCLSLWLRQNLPFDPLPRSFEVKSLGDFAAGLPEDLLLCPVRSLSAYLDRTSGIVNRPRRLFVSSKCPSRAMSKNSVSYMLREVIVHSGASSQGGQVPRAHSIRGIATSSAFFRNCSLRSVREAASWRSNTVFTSFYLRDLSFTSEGVHSLGLFVAAGERIG